MNNKIIIENAIRSGNIGLAQGEAIPAGVINGAVARPLGRGFAFRAVRMSHLHSTE